MGRPEYEIVAQYMAEHQCTDRVACERLDYNFEAYRAWLYREQKRGESAPKKKRGRPPRETVVNEGETQPSIAETIEVLEMNIQILKKTLGI